MHDLQPENILERVEVAIAVQQSVRVLETERRDEAVDGLADRSPAGTQAAKVSRGRLRDPLEHLAHSQVEQPQTLAIRLAIEPLDFGCADAAQVVDPDPGVDRDADTRCESDRRMS